MPLQRTYLSLIAAIAIVMLAVFILGTLLLRVVEPVNHSNLEPALSSLATVGGIVSSLSLTGTAVLSLSATYKERVLDVYGGAVRGILFIGFASIVLLALAMAIAPIWLSADWVPLLISYGVCYMVAVLVLTTWLVLNAFRIDSKRVPEPAPDPTILRHDE